MARIRISSTLFAGLLLLALPGCTDSELDGVPRIDEDGRLDTGGGDTAVQDTGWSGCSAHEECRSVLALGACDEPVCNADGSCSAKRREACCIGDSDCPALGDPCLVNTCPQPGGGCVARDTCGCRSDDECRSEDRCLIGRCGADGACSFEANPACECQGDGQCEDGSVCTRDACVDGRCLHEAVAGCCTSDRECLDDDPCTLDFCRADRGECGHETVPDCGGCTAQSCDDGDPCTLDVCSDLGCSNIPDEQNPDCRTCRNNNDCNDGDECTRDRCREGTCFYEPATFPDGTPLCGCQANEQCFDDDPCTTDVCDAGVCVSFFDPGTPGCGCGGAADCDDGDRCTSDSCQADGRCRHDLIPGCDACGGACDDGDRCTIDLCLPDSGQCLHERDPNCSRCVEGCDDGDICTADFCDEAIGECTHEPLAPCNPNGCDSDEQCADASECTLNSCVAGECVSQGIPGCCRETSDCDDGSACTEDTCFRGAGMCFNEAIDCDDDDPCTHDSCDATLGCVSVPNPDSPDCTCVPELLWTRSFLTHEEPDIEIDGSGADVRWRVDDVRAFSPEQSLRYGDEQGDDYATGFRTFGRATGPLLTVAEAAGEVRLDFMVFVDIDADPERDSLRARVLFGNQNVIVWDRLELETGLFGQWFPVSVALPDEVIGRDIQLRFVFDSLDGEGNQGQGVFVDDIAVYTTCP